MSDPLSLLAITEFTRPAWNSFLWAIIYGVMGIVLTIAGYKIFDWVTPINVEKELSERQNIAVAIVAAAVIIGIAIVMHAAISG